MGECQSKKKKEEKKNDEKNNLTLNNQDQVRCVVPLTMFEITLTNTFETLEKASMAGSSLDIWTLVSGIIFTSEDICTV